MSVGHHDLEGWDDAEVYITDGPYKGYHGVILSRTAQVVRARLLVYGRALEVELPVAVCCPGGMILQELDAALERLREDAIAAWWSQGRQTAPGSTEGMWLRWQEEAQELDWSVEHLRAYLTSRMRELAQSPRAAQPGWLSQQWAQLREHYLSGERRGSWGEAQERARVAALDLYHSVSAQQARQALAREQTLAQGPTRAALPDQRDRVIAQALEAWPAIKARVERTHGLTLPLEVAWFWSCVQSLNSLERLIWEQALGLRPAGVLTLFELSEQLEHVCASRAEVMVGRHYHDLPEFLTVALDAARGVHVGLWYDDPRQLPTHVVSYRTPCLWPQLVREGGSLVQHVLNALDEAQESAHYEEDPPREALVEQLRASVLAHLEAFESRVGQPLWRPGQADTTPRQETLHGFGVASPCGVEPRQLSELRQLLIKDDPRLDQLRELAQQRCAHGSATMMLALGHDYHTMSAGDGLMEARAAELLLEAYAALGYDALGRIALEHFRQRALDRPATYGLMSS